MGPTQVSSMAEVNEGLGLTWADAALGVVRAGPVEGSGGLAGAGVPHAAHRALSSATARILTLVRRWTAPGSCRAG